MHDVTFILKGKGKISASKLLLDIEVTMDLKVLEECILNGKVKFTLEEILGIAKHEFHEVII